MNITIYGKPMCSQCTMAKNFLDARNIPYDYKELDVDFVREDLMAIAPGARAYPVIFFQGQQVGYQQLPMLVQEQIADNTNLLMEG